ncbi:Probable carbohydrate esterase At4g34215 [Linum grandiflorum]
MEIIYPLILMILVMNHAIVPILSSSPPANIFILAGQSNMAGRGGVINNTATGKMEWDRIVPAQCQPNPSILRLSKDLIWVTGQEPLHADIDFTKTNGVGPGMAFANALVTQDPTVGVLGLVPCAIGGTNINQWEKDGELYGELMKRSEAAVAIGGGKIRALLWYQGESDTNSREDADQYKGRLETLFYHVRQDLQLPSLPIIQVALASSEGPFKETVRNAQLGISLPNLVTVDADGLPIGPDGLHLTTASQVQLVLYKHAAEAAGNESTSTSSSPPSPTDIFILAGQSNMAGRGGVEHGKWNGVVPRQSAPNPRILRLSGRLEWEVAKEPLHWDIDVEENKTCGVGPGMAFANSLLLNSNTSKSGGNMVVGLVPCAMGGTGIRRWRKGRRLYRRMVGRTRAAARDGGKIRGLLWYQGESDTVRREDGEGYKWRLEKLISDLRSDLRIPTLPLLLVALASGEGRFIEEVRQAQLGIKLANVKCVDAKGLGLKTDHLHLTTSSQGEERLNEEGAIETKVETVDHRSSAGEGEPGTQKVGVVHLRRNDKNKESSGVGGVLAGTAAAVSNTFKSAKEAIMGKAANNDNKHPGSDTPQ